MTCEVFSSYRIAIADLDTWYIGVEIKILVLCRPRVHMFPCRVLPQPVAFAGVCVAADGVVLIGQPDDEDDVEGRGRVVEELRHDGLHAWRQEVTSAGQHAFGLGKKKLLWFFILKCVFSTPLFIQYLHTNFSQSALIYWNFFGSFIDCKYKM